MESAKKWLTLEHLLHFTLYVAVFSMPVQTVVCNISLLCAFGLSIIKVIKEKNCSTPLSLAPATIFVFYIISFLYSENIKDANHAMELGATFLFVPLTFTFARSWFTPKFCDQLTTLFLFSVIFFCFINYIHTIISTGQYLPTSGTNNFTYYDKLSRQSFTKPLGIAPLYLSMYILMSLVIAFQKVKNQAFLFLITTMSVFFLLILASKNQLIVFPFLFSFLFWKYLKMPLSIKIVTLTSLFGLILVFAIKSDQIRYRFIQEMNDAPSERVILWKSSFEIISENLFLGVGIGDRGDAIDEILIKNGNSSLKGYNPHNQYLDYLITFGIFGLLGFIVILLIPLLKSNDLLFILFILIIASSAFTESILFRQRGVVFFLVFYGIFGISHGFFSKSSPPIAGTLSNKILP